VQASVEAATTLLPSGGADRLTELGIVAEDELIPISVVALLWQATGGLTEEQTRSLCQALARLSLVTLDPRHGGRIGLHDVIRTYLRSDLGTADLTRLNSLLVDAVAETLPAAQPLAPTAPSPEYTWWQLQDDYLLDHLIDHLIAADHTASAEATASDLRWVEARLAQRRPSSPWSDLSRLHQERCEGDGCLVGLGGLVVAGGDAAPLLQAVGWRAPAPAATSQPVADLVGPLRDGVADAAPSQPGVDGPGTGDPQSASYPRHPHRLFAPAPLVPAKRYMPRRLGS
jgi:hypothetical protein